MKSFGGRRILVFDECDLRINAKDNRFIGNVLATISDMNAGSGDKVVAGLRRA